MVEANTTDLNTYRTPERRAGAAEFTSETDVRLHEASKRLLSPEAARALLLAHRAYDTKRAEDPTYEKSPAQLVAEYAIACGVNLSTARRSELDQDVVQQEAA